MSDDARGPQGSEKLAEAARVLRRDLEAALAEAHRRDPSRAGPLASEADQVPGDWRDAEIARLRAELAEARRERAEAAARAQAREAEVARLTKEVTKAKAAQSRDVSAEVARLRAELEAVLGSSSWRLTSPLRGALDRLRGRRPPA